MTERKKERGNHRERQTDRKIEEARRGKINNDKENPYFI